jgi:Tol biopolymer transport system component/predicted Ser/Thr protein kinase
MPLFPGAKLGPYEIVAAIGAGGMGEVYRARDTRLGRDVAIKVLPQHLSSDAQLKERFDREARAISSLNHARICTLHDVGHQEGVDFLVMEFLEGETLAERLRKGPLSLKEALKIGIEVCEALDVAHRAGIVHRDLKPGNIMLTKNGAKLMDFGLAKASAGGAIASGSAPLLSATVTISGPSPNSPLTTAGQVVGTIQYMSPEQIEGKDADARSDVFAAGAVLYEMAAGKRPFEGKSQISVASAILEKDPEPISKIRPLTPPAFEHVVSTCLAKSPDDRYQSARDVKLELKWIAEGSSQLTAVATKPAAKAGKDFLPWAAAALLALALPAVFFLARGTKSPEVQYTSVTYRQGKLEAARFSHDGQTIVYSGEWEGEAPQVATSRIGSPESRALGIQSATLGAVSASDELAVFRGCEYIFLMDCGGTLASVSLSGGSPRDLAGHVAYADWSPDGKQLAVSKMSAGGAQLEFPPGHILFQQKSGWFGHPRFSPDGKLIAFENHPVVDQDDGVIEVVDLAGKSTVLTRRFISLEGLAWSPDGKELWFAGDSSARTGWADSIRAVTLAGKERAVLLLPSMRLHDIAKDGRVLLSHENWRRQLRGFFPGDKNEHSYSWLDNTNPTSMSSDGRVLSFTEGGEVYYIEGERLGYYRATDGSGAVSAGSGTTTVSPDGKSLLRVSQKSTKLLLQPIGLGEPLELPTPGLMAFDHAAWSDDGRFISYEAQTTQNEWNAYAQPLAGGPPILLQAGTRHSFPKLSPDGSMAALRGDRGGISIYKLDGSKPLALAGTLESEYPVRFANGGKSLLVSEATGHNELVLTLVDLANGHRTPWKRFQTDAQNRSLPFIVTPDLKYYAYASPLFSSDLYIVDNLH